MFARPAGVVSCMMTPYLLLVLACQDSNPTGKVPETPAIADSTAETDTAPDTDSGADAGPGCVTRSRPRFGAIRWDARQGDGSVNSIVECTYSPAHWHDRLPGFAEELGADSVSIRGNDPAIMAGEIAWAQVAGVDDWAFVAYPPEIGMSDGLRLYLDSPHAGLDFALILQGSWLSLDSEVSWSERVARSVELFFDTRSVRVDGEPPLVFLFDAPNRWGTARFPAIGDAAGAFTELGDHVEEGLAWVDAHVPRRRAGRGPRLGLAGRCRGCRVDRELAIHGRRVGGPRLGGAGRRVRDADRHRHEPERDAVGGRLRASWGVRSGW